VTAGAATISISGRVVVKDGGPLAGVTVTAYRTNDHVSAATTTDSNGAYSFVGLQGGPQVNYEVWAGRTGYGFYPVPAGVRASVRRSDYSGLYRTVIRLDATPGANLASADFAAYNGSNSPVALASTGQRTSYVAGDDGSLQKGATWPTARFIDPQDGTVRDNLTGLVWLRDAGCIAAANWQGALTAANQLASGSCGLSDGSTAGQWRVPNVIELESLVDVSQSRPALSIGHPFVNVAASYWTSTTYYGDVTNAWVIRFTDGRYLNDLSSNGKASSTHATWAVRTGDRGAVQLQETGQYLVYGSRDDASIHSGVPLTDPRFIDKGDGTITDTVTGLVWLKQADCIHLGWSAAAGAINALASGQCGLSDGSTAGSWRMPNRAEMLSLADRALGNHADYYGDVFLKPDQSIDRAAIFDHFVTAEYYWTSTTDAADANQAWTLYSCDFGVYDIPKINTGYSLAVR
jgi:hypothetical protein